MPRPLVAAGLSLGLLAGWASSAKAVLIIATGNQLAPVPTVPGDGAFGAVWAVGGVTSLAQADAIIAAGNPNATFTATTIDYPSHSVPISTIQLEPTQATQQITVEGNRISDFLGVDRNSLVGQDFFTAGGFVMDIHGVIAITPDMDIRPDLDTLTSVFFGLGSQDGGRLSIAGTDVLHSDGPRSFAYTVNDATNPAHFVMPGLYFFDLTYFAQSGPGGLQLFVSGTGDPQPGAPTGTVSIFPSADLYSAVPVPEPTALGAIAGAAAVGLVRRRRRLA